MEQQATNFRSTGERSRLVVQNVRAAYRNHKALLAEVKLFGNLAIELEGRWHVVVAKRARAHGIALVVAERWGCKRRAGLTSANRESDVRRVHT